MGSGKSTLLEKFESDAVATFDLDREVLKPYLREFNSLGELIEDWGFPRFRDEEFKKLKELVEMAPNPSVISLGGGTLTRKEGLEFLLNHPQIRLVWLSTPFPVCWERIAKVKGRPLLAQGKEAMERLYNERLGTYQMASSHLDVDAQSKINNFADLKRHLEALGH
jgi:shikimate kinase